MTEDSDDDNKSKSNKDQKNSKPNKDKGSIMSMVENILKIWGNKSGKLVKK